MLSTKLKEAAGNSADATLYVDDVFSTYLYTGTGVGLTIVNNIDISGRGGLVWLKNRGFVSNHSLQDTTRPASYQLSSNLTAAQSTTLGDLTSFNNNGFSLGTSGGGNNITGNVASWTFRKAAKFFDVVTYTGDGSARTIAHSLGVAPGMVIVKRTDTSSDWQVYHRSLTSAAYSIQLNLTNAQASAPTVWNSTAPTSSVFSVGTDATVNASGGTYVAYLYAHDTSSTGIIQCGSWDNPGTAPVNVTLGWEPQYILVKNATNPQNWFVVDTMRGDSLTGQAYLKPNTSDAETISSGAPGYPAPTATGFTSYLGLEGTYIYMAIRMPNKPPTSGTQVFMPTSTTSSTITPTSAGFPVDLLLESLTSNSSSKVAVDRLRGGDLFLWTNLTNAEQNQSPSGSSFDNNTSVLWKYTASGYPLIFWNFKRAPGFFDVVCYTGTGSATTQTHNLGVVPEMMIVKCRSSTSQWPIYATPLGNSNGMFLSLTNASSSLPTIWNSTTPTASVFTIGTSGSVNASGFTFVAYLFATLAGISKVGSYTGNGTGQAIACGFSAGARFVLIKRTDSTGDWYTFDSARGLTSGSSPYLLLNSTAAEVTGNNGVYASTGGFTLGATAITTTNIATATYIFLAVA